MNSIESVLKAAIPASTFAGECPRHGTYQAAREKSLYWKECPDCLALQAASFKKDAEARDDERRMIAIKNRKDASGIPERFIGKTFSTYEAKNAGQKAAFEFATEYAINLSLPEKSGRGAIFCGKPGTGKTHLAISIGLHAIDGGKSVFFVTVQRIMRSFKESWRKDADYCETDVINSLVTPDLLIIDEIGIQFGSEFEKNAMFDVLNTRYEKQKPTLMLSNLEPLEVKAFLGERVFDRLREDGGKCIPFNWASHRGQA